MSSPQVWFICARCENRSPSTVGYAGLPRGRPSASPAPRPRRAAFAAVEVTDLPAPGDPALAADMRDVLARLAPEHRAVLVLRDIEGLDEHAAAEILSVPEER